MRPPRALAGALLLGWLALGLAGCSLVEPQGPKVPPPPHAQGQALYEDAVAALQAGKHATAQAWFQSLAHSTPDPALARRARYGAAAAAQAGAALELWRAWQREAPPSLPAEDPRLLAPALANLEACLTARPAPAPKADNGETQARLARLNEENQRLKKQLADLEALHKELLERKNRLGR